jgi:hypothetical protein
MTKTIIRFVFSVVVQLRVTPLTDPQVLEHLSVIDGIIPTHAYLLERTKRDVSKTDGTVKCKSVLLYYRVVNKAGMPGSVSTLVTNVSVVVNSQLPSVVASVVNSFGGSGADEVRETMAKTRVYLAQELGDSREAPPASTRVRGKGTGRGFHLGG